jgi:hypothetical protein
LAGKKFTASFEARPCDFATPGIFSSPGGGGFHAYLLEVSMVIYSSSHKQFQTTLTPIEILRLHLSLDANSTLTNLLHAVRPPIGEPGLSYVMAAADVAVDIYGETLASPTKMFVDLQRRLKNLCAEAESSRHQWDQVAYLEEPLRRRLMSFPAWALMYHLSHSPSKLAEHAATGVELAYSLATGKPFRRDYATALRRSLKAEAYLDANGDPRTFDWQPHFREVSRQAALIFEGVPGPVPELLTGDSFEKRAARELRNKSLYASAKTRQAVLDSQCQSPRQFLASAKQLRLLVGAGDDTAILVMISSMSGLSMETCMHMPIASPDDDQWVMFYDVDEGSIKMSTVNNRDGNCCVFDQAA